MFVDYDVLVEKGEQWC